MSLLSLGTIKRATKAVLPKKLVLALNSRRIRMGDLRRVEPISRSFGLSRGQPVDRYYIESFLNDNSADIQGRVLEVGDDRYTKQFGRENVTANDVLHVTEGNEQATIVEDLSHADQIPSDQYDCIICTQTLMFVFDVDAAINTIHRILKPGGVVLATTAGISQICRWDMDQWGDYWRFTSMAARRLFEESFPPANVTVKTFGNVLTAVAFLHGLASQDLKQEEFEHNDQDYELIVGVRAVKPSQSL